MSAFRQYSQAQTLVLNLNGAAIPIANFGHALNSRAQLSGEFQVAVEYGLITFFCGRATLERSVELDE
jgi:hypothetical protein